MISFLLTYAQCSQFPPPYTHSLKGNELEIVRHSDSEVVATFRAESGWVGCAYRDEPQWSPNGNACVIPADGELLFWNTTNGFKTIKFSTDEIWDYFLDNFQFTPDGAYLFFRIGASGMCFIDEGYLYIANHKTGEYAFLNESVRSAKVDKGAIVMTLRNYYTAPNTNEGIEEFHLKTVPFPPQIVH